MLLTIFINKSSIMFLHIFCFVRTENSCLVTILILFVFHFVLISFEKMFLFPFNVLVNDSGSEIDACCEVVHG